MQFLREQAALSATEITADTVNDFTADSEEESEAEELPDTPKGYKPVWNKILANIVEMSSRGNESKASFHNKNGSAWAPKVNGKHSKHVKHVSLKFGGELSRGISVSRMIQANIPMWKEVLPGLESWLVSKIASWHNVEGYSIQWLCVVSIDRRGKLYLLFNKSHCSFILFVQLFMLLVAYWC